MCHVSQIDHQRNTCMCTSYCSCCCYNTPGLREVRFAHRFRRVSAHYPGKSTGMGKLSLRQIYGITLHVVARRGSTAGKTESRQEWCMPRDPLTTTTVPRLLWSCLPPPPQFPELCIWRPSIQINECMEEIKYLNPSSTYGWNFILDYDGANRSWTLTSMYKDD